MPMGMEKGHWLVLGLALLALLGIASDSLSQEEGPPALVAGEESSAPAERNRPIPGQEQAVPLDALGNPFDELHGKRNVKKVPKEQPQAPVPPEAPAPTAPATEAKGEPAVAPPPKEPVALPVLTGIVRSDSGSMAILSVGKASGPVAEGEALSGVTVERIDAGGVLVQSASGEQYLPLAR